LGDACRIMLEEQGPTPSDGTTEMKEIEVLA